jgi:hypothetical protein
MVEKIVNNAEEKELFAGARGSMDAFELPTGWLDTETGKLYKDIEIQEITGNEEDMLVAKNLSANQRMNNLMVACVQRIGPHSDKMMIRKIVSELVSNDRFFLVYKIREISLGPVYKFTAPCIHCQDNQLRIVDLSEVVFPGLKNPMKRIYEGVLPKTNLPYKWKILDGEGEELAQKIIKKNENDLLSAAILQRLQEIDGHPATIDTLKRLPIMDRNFLRNEFIQIEGEIDDKIIVDCPSCGKEFEVTADVGKKEFFFPTAF